MVAESISEVRKAFTFTTDAHLTLQAADICASRCASAEVRTEHLLLALVDFRDLAIDALFTKYNVTRTAIEYELALEERRYNDRVFAGQQAIVIPHVGIDLSLASALGLAVDEVRDSMTSAQREPVDLYHLLIGLALEPNGFASWFLKNQGLDYVRLRREFSSKNKIPSTAPIYFG